MPALTLMLCTLVSFSLDPAAGTAGSAGASKPAPIRALEMTCLDPVTIGFATFQSHNQKVLANRFGIFTTHVRTRNQEYTSQTWRLSRSTDGGKNFETIFEAVNGTSAPVIESDSEGNLYLARPDFVDGNAYLYRFLAKNDFRDPIITTLPKGSAGKYTMCLDEQRGQLTYFAHNNNFFVIGLDGKIRLSCQLLKDGRDAMLQYPQLYLDQQGRLHAAWTTEQHGIYLYWDIHHMVSPDGGQTWHNLDGQPLIPPIVADQTGPAMRITLDDEFEVHTWLSSFLVLDGKVHFVYLSTPSKESPEHAKDFPPRQHYMRYDIATGKREADIQPVFQGETIRLEGSDGFFAVGHSKHGPALYCVGHAGEHLGCLVSYDNGKTWHDYARSTETYNLYSVGGCRAVTSDGYLIGTFTDQRGNNLTPDQKSRVFFFRVKAE